MGGRFSAVAHEIAASAGHFRSEQVFRFVTFWSIRQAAAVATGCEAVEKYTEYGFRPGAEQGWKTPRPCLVLRRILTIKTL